MDCNKYGEFLSWYNGEFGESSLLRESPYIQDEHDERKMVCDNYYSIPKKFFGWDKQNKTKIYGKWLDGENRHTKIYTSGVILRKLNPEATADDLLREIVSILLTYYDICDPDKSLKFTKITILQLLESVLKADLGREMKKVKHSSFKVSDVFCMKNRVSKKQVLGCLLGEKNREKKEERYREIDYFYDPTITWENGKRVTQQQWIEILEENGIMVSLRTFQSYLSNRGYSKSIRKGNKNNATSKSNMSNHYTIRFASCTFLDEEECTLDESWIVSDRKFREIVEGIHGTDEFRAKWKV